MNTENITLQNTESLKIAVEKLENYLNKFQIAKGIYELKNLGIIHRDIKPENIIGHK